MNFHTLLTTAPERPVFRKSAFGSLLFSARLGIVLRIEMGNRAASVNEGFVRQSHIFLHGGTKFPRQPLRVIRIFGVYRSLTQPSNFFF
jgi:hypothetical protein